MSNLETSLAQTSEEPTSKRGLHAAVGGPQAAVGGVVGGAVEFLGFHLTNGALRLPEVKETRQKISKMTDDIGKMTDDIGTVKLAILAGVGLYGFCVAGRALKNLFGKDRSGGSDRGDTGGDDGVQERQLMPVVLTPREWDRS